MKNGGSFHSYVKLPEGTPSLPVQLSQVDPSLVFSKAAHRGWNAPCRCPTMSCGRWREIAKKMQETNSKWCNIGLFTYHGYFLLEWCNISKWNVLFHVYIPDYRTARNSIHQIPLKYLFQQWLTVFTSATVGIFWKSLADVPLQMGLQATQVHFPKGNHWRWKEMESPSIVSWKSNDIGLRWIKKR